jgi:hypothetical protein
MLTKIPNATTPYQKAHNNIMDVLPLVETVFDAYTIVCAAKREYSLTQQESWDLLEEVITYNSLQR